MINVQKVSSLLKLTTHHDKDERFMATSDIITEIEKVDGCLQKSLQSPIRNAVLKQLDDISSDVQTVAVKCLSILVRQVDADMVVDIVCKLAKLVAKPGKESSRDIYSIGLKTIINAIEENLGQAVAPKLATVILSNVTAASSELMVTVLDLLKDLLQRFGSLASDQHEAVVDLLTRCLSDGSDTVRKRANTALGVLVVVLSDERFHALMGHLVARMAQKDVPSHLQYTNIQSFSIISQSAGSRVAPYLKDIVPMLQSFCHLDAQEAQAAEESSEELIDLWEHCLQAFEAILLRCPTEITSYVDDVVAICLQFINYDPNYTYNDEEDDADMAGEGGAMQTGNESDGGDGDGWADSDDDGWDNDDQEQAVDDDDVSWKVRRAAVRVLSAVITARPDLLPGLYKQLCEVLIAQFRERDHNVKLTVLEATRELLRRSVVSRGDLDTDPLQVVIVHRLGSFATLTEQIPALLQQCDRELKKGLPNDCRLGVYAVLTQLAAVRQGELSQHLQALVDHVLEGMTAEDVRLSAESLRLARLLCGTHSPDTLAPYVSALAAAAVERAQQDLGQIKVEAVRLCGQLAPLLGADAATASLLHRAVFAQLLLTDIDQEVKEACMHTVATIIVYLGHLLGEDVALCLPILLARLPNEVTRMAALQALERIAAAEVGGDMSCVLDEAVDLLLTFLRKESQALRHASAKTLSALLKSKSTKTIQAEGLVRALEAVGPLISDADLHLTQLSLELVVSVVGSTQVTAGALHTVLARVLPTLKSPLLQGDNLQSVLILFKQLATASAIPSTELLQMLLSCLDAGCSPHNCRAVAQCATAVISTGENAAARATMQGFIKDIHSAETPLQRKQLALLILGEYGADHDLTSLQGAEDAVFSALNHESDAIQHAASFALGNMAVGNLAQGLAHLLQRIKQETEGTRRYMLLSSLKEVINKHAGADRRALFEPHLAAVAALLFGEADSKDESVRYMAASCLGGLALMDGATIYRKIGTYMDSTSPTMRALVVSALRASLSSKMEGASAVDPASALVLQKVPTLLQDADLAVRRQSLLTVNAIAHHNVPLIESMLASNIIPVLYHEMQPDAKLVRTVDFGPFKHKVDDGLPLRKAAFQCLETLVDRASHTLEMRQFLRHVMKALADSDDIQILAYDMIEKVAKWHGPALLEVLEELPAAVMGSVKGQLKMAKQENAEPHRARAVLRVAVRCLHTVRCLPNAELCTAFCSFYLRVLKTELLAKLLEEMKASR